MRTMRNMPGPEIAALVERARKGDQDALAGLVDMTQDRLYRFCLHLSGNVQMAEDVCQETLVSALQQLDSVKEPQKILSWMFMVAKNCFLQKIRSGKREEPVSGEDQVGADIPQDSDLQSRVEVQECLAQMDPIDRMSLILVDLDEYSYAEAAEIIGCTESAVRSRLHRARKDFLKKYQKA